MLRPSVLIYRTGQLGDTLVSLPAVRAIREGYPDHQLVLLTDRQTRAGFVSSWDVFETTGLFDRVIFYTPAATVTGWLLQLVQIRRSVRRVRPEALFYLRDPHWKDSRRDWWFFKMICAIPQIHGIEETGYAFGERDAAGRLWRLPSETNRLLGIVAAAGVPIVSRTTVNSLPVGPIEQARVNRFLRDRDVPSGARLIAMAPGSKMRAKQWPVERFEALARRLLAFDPRVWLVLVGGVEDASLAAGVVRACGRRVVDTTGHLTVLESADALRRCELYIGNDTGAMHLAAAMGTRCIAIFSARDHPGRWDPCGAGNVIFRADPPCSGCLLQECLEHRMACLTAIGVDDVGAAAERLLGAAAPALA